jgi:hypothetical protein
VDNILSFCRRVNIFGKEQHVEALAASCQDAERQKAGRVDTWRSINLPEGYHWERVKSVKRMGVMRTVAITVPHYHTFLTDFVEHNTGLMVGLASAIAPRYAGTPYRIRFVSSVELMEALRPSDGPYGAGAQERATLLDTVMRVRLLLLDDLGKDKPSEWIHDRLFMLMNHRTDHLLPTFITTNYPLEDLVARVGEGVVDRLVEACDVIEMDTDAPNLRLQMSV